MNADKVAGVALDNWKLPIFKRHLDAAGYKYEEAGQLTAGIFILKVQYEWVHELNSIIEAAQAECGDTRSKAAN